MTLGGISYVNDNCDGIKYIIDNGKYVSLDGTDLSSIHVWSNV